MSEPTLQQLRYLVALGEHGHFGRAAAACFVSQPALSAQLRELERRLGVTVVERQRSGLLFTPVGRDVLERARRLLAEADDLVAAAAAGRGVVGPVRVGTIPTVGPYLLARTVPVLHNAVPGAALELHEATTDLLVGQLRGGTLDVLLLATAPDDPDLESVALGADPFLLAVPARHALARGRGPVSLDDLASLRVLVLTEGHCLRDQALAVCRGPNAEASSVAASSLATLVQMVAAGMGVTLLPASAAALEARPGNGIAVRRFRSPAPSRTIGLTWRRSSPNRAMFAGLATLLRPALSLS